MQEQILNELIKPYLGLRDLTVGNINVANHQMISNFKQLVAQGFITIKTETKDESKEAEPEKSGD